MTHGTVAGYMKACRCTPCREAWNAYQRVYQKAYRARRKAHREAKARQIEEAA